MRKLMTKEVTSTTVKSAIVTVTDGIPSLEQLEDVTLLGNVSPEKAKKELNKKFGKDVTVIEVKPETNIYEMAVEDFIQVASLKEEEVTA